MSSDLPIRRTAEGRTVRAIGLVSGGLDSTLAVHVIREQGIEVLAVNFSTGFCRSDHHRAMASFGSEQDPRRLRNEALRAGSDLKVPVRVVDISKDYMEIILKPRHGYGANMNPCIDCRAYMLRAAAKIMEEEGADFVFTGEVLGQRPMSQHLRAMKIVEKDAGLEGRLLRPLSAKLLAPTLVEKEGLVDREQLLRIQGRSRKQQMARAEEAGLQDIPSPAGGCCFLTDEIYASRFYDLIRHLPEGGKPDEKGTLLLKVGRHFRLSPDFKLIIGREEAENNFLHHFYPEALFLEALDHSGPLAIVESFTEQEPVAEQLEIMASMVARYGKGRKEETVRVEVRGQDRKEILEVRPLADDSETEAWRIPEKFDAADHLR